MNVFKSLFSDPIKPQSHILSPEKSKGYDFVSVKKQGKFSRIESTTVRLKLGGSNLSVAVHSNQFYTETELPKSNLFDKAYKRITGHDRWVPLMIGENVKGKPIYVRVNYASLKKEVFEDKEALPMANQKLSSAVDNKVKVKIIESALDGAKEFLELYEKRSGEYPLNARRPDNVQLVTKRAFSCWSRIQEAIKIFKESEVGSLTFEGSVDDATARRAVANVDDRLRVFLIKNLLKEVDDIALGIEDALADQEITEKQIESLKVKQPFIEHMHERHKNRTGGQDAFTLVGSYYSLVQSGGRKKHRNFSHRA